jgi:outer membrane protein assembly factor BamB
MHPVAVITLLERRMQLALALGLALGALGCSRTRGADPIGSVATSTSDAGAKPCPVCDDGQFCNGVELCAPESLSCLPGKPPDCDDRDECTLDRCDSTLNGCSHQAQPRDQDRDGFDACSGDCDDRDPAVHPGATESCNQIDDDCDGQVDEGLRSECGDCRPGCRLLHLPGEGDVWHPTADNSDAVEVSGDGGPLVLTSDTHQRFDAWIANFVKGQVTKLDTRDGTQLARYDSVLLDGNNGAEPADEACDQNGIGQKPAGNCPSRTAVDFEGAVYVANRAFGRQGTVTKIAGFEQDCIDRNRDGTIQTSRDVNGNGQIDAYVEGEMLGQDDECLLWTVDVGGVAGVPRAVAIAADGSVWVGLHGDSRVVQLDPSNGAVLSQIAVPGFKPYGAAMDARGRLWLVESLTGHILSIDTATGSAGESISAPAPEDGCPSSYGIAVDPEGRVWIAGFTCPYAFGYDPSAGRWTSVHLPDSGVTRGIAADDQGQIFVAASHEWIHVDPSSTFGFIEASDPITRLTVFRADDGRGVRVFGTPAAPLPGSGAIGVGLDSEGRAWLVNQQSGSATRVNIDSGEIKHFGAGDLPYTYSDFTGFALRRITAPSGFIRGVLEGCAMGPTQWEQLTVDAKLSGAAQIQIRVRTAGDSKALDAAHWLGPWDSASIDLTAAPGPLAQEHLLEVEARLVSGDRQSSPALSQITVRVNCSQP